MINILYELRKVLSSLTIVDFSKKFKLIESLSKDTKVLR
jgi:hypothetical protein